MQIPTGVHSIKEVQDSVQLKVMAEAQQQLFTLWCMAVTGVREVAAKGYQWAMVKLEEVEIGDKKVKLPQYCLQDREKFAQDLVKQIAKDMNAYDGIGRKNLAEPKGKGQAGQQRQRMQPQ